MKKGILILLGVIIFGFSAASHAGSVTYFDIDKLDTKLSKGNNATLTGKFDITASGIEGDSYTLGLPYMLFPQTFTDVGGFTPGQDSITSATVYFAVRDDQLFDSSEYLKVKIEDLNQGKFEVGINIAAYDVEASLMGNLDATGRLNYKLKATKGDFIVDYAALEVNTFTSINEQPQIVPIPAATWAGGCMLFGLAALRKMRNR